MSEAVEEPLTYIFDTFKDGNRVDLKSIKTYFDTSTLNDMQINP